jgi:hypothetical protein
VKGLQWRLLLLSNVAAGIVFSAFWCLVFVAPKSMSSALPPPSQELPGVFQLMVRGNGWMQIVALLSTCLLVANIAWLLYGRQPKAPTSHVISETEDGPVKISREALETTLRTAGEALDEISRLRVSVDPSGGSKRILVRAQFQAPDGLSIQDASHKLRRTMGLRFQELVRLSEGTRLEMDIEFLGFSGKLVKRPAQEAEELQ